MYTWILTFEKISFHQCFVVLQKFYGRKSCRSFHRVFANHDFSVSESFLRQWFFSNLFSNNLRLNPLNKIDFMNGPEHIGSYHWLQSEFKAVKAIGWLFALPPHHHFKEVRFGVKLTLWPNCAIFHAIISMQQPATAQPNNDDDEIVFPKKCFCIKPLKSNNECPVYKWLLIFKYKT